MTTFDPRAHLIKLQGKEYLEVKWRLVWLREADPGATIMTELVAYDVAAEWAIVRAVVTLTTGASAVGTVLQRPTGIAKDFIANGETSAIGRALGALGFGTQFAPEFDQGEQVVDAPVQRPATRPAPTNLATHGVQYEVAKGREATPAAAPTSDRPDVIPAPLWERACEVALDYGLTPANLEAAVRDVYGHTVAAHVTRDELTTLVQAIKATTLRYRDGRWQIEVPMLIEQLADATR